MKDNYLSDSEISNFSWF